MGNAAMARKILRPYNDDNPIIDTTPPPAQPVALTGRARAMLIMRLTLELMREQRGECYWCGVPMWHPRWTDNAAIDDTDFEDRATFDHRIPRSKGGADTKENGVVACYSCNQHRGDLPFEEYENWPPS